MKLADTPLKRTSVTPLKPLPKMVTSVPTTPLVGLKELIAGAVNSVKSPALKPVPSAFVTLIGPVLAPRGTVA